MKLWLVIPVVVVALSFGTGCQNGPVKIDDKNISSIEFKGVVIGTFFGKTTYHNWKAEQALIVRNPQGYTERIYVPQYEENILHGMLAYPVMNGEIKEGDSLFVKSAGYLGFSGGKCLIMYSSSSEGFTSFDEEMKKLGMER